ncbi:MAG TPA: hypothetical protein VFR49_16680, partial [Solirubrobacteraceae bacterium]|nr:hypothetical protein [Solirubrobacteraceae bacterium]
MSRLRQQHGMAMVVALMVMTVTMLLAGVAVTVAVHANDLSNRDTAGKTALQAADAGLHVATYRLNVLRPDAGHCPTSPATTIGAANLCAGVGPEALGNGASFQYWVSGPLASTDTCAGGTVSNGQNVIAQRCITAAGTVNGVVGARVEERVAAY